MAPGGDRRAAPLAPCRLPVGVVGLLEAVEVPQDVGPVAQGEGVVGLQVQGLVADHQGLVGLIGEPEGMGTVGQEAMVPWLAGRGPPPEHGRLPPVQALLGGDGLGDWIDRHEPRVAAAASGSHRSRQQKSPLERGLEVR